MKRERERERDKSEKREVRIETHTYNTPGKCRTVSLHAAFRSARVASISESFPLQLVEMQKDRRDYADLLMINSNIKIISILYEDLISNSLSKNEYKHLQIIRKDSTIWFTLACWNENKGSLSQFVKLTQSTFEQVYFEFQSRNWQRKRRYNITGLKTRTKKSSSVHNRNCERSYPLFWNATLNYGFIIWLKTRDNVSSFSSTSCPPDNPPDFNRASGVLLPIRWQSDAADASG